MILAALNDDGKGPYVYCKFGVSHCDDQFCTCIDNAAYRTRYELERERRGWTLGRTPSNFIAYLVLSAVIGAELGALVFLGLMLIGALK